MATKSFLTAEQVAEARELLRAPLSPPNGDENKRVELKAAELSHWLGEKLEIRLGQHPLWLTCEPVALGSWARGELSPKSDIDLLFLGPEESVKLLVQDFSREGLKIRYRVPEDADDWTKGVEAFDVLALLSAVPLEEKASIKLAHQLEVLRRKRGKFRTKLLSAMRAERKSRAERYDSISNFLEPNLKYGPGGLRDLEQAIVARSLFPERFTGEEHAFEVLSYYKAFFLLTRQRLHLAEGASEILSAPEQKPLSDWLGFKDPKHFMREIQKGVSRVSFYADWAIEQASQPLARIESVNARKLKTPRAIFSSLREDPSLLMQNHVRTAADQVFRDTRPTPELGREVGSWLTKLIHPDAKEGPLVALFRSRLIDHCVPEFRKIVGHVQHDQYHRFSVDAHILQALRELRRLIQHPKLAGKLSQHIESLTKREREVLAFACLYHDIAKGRGGDHSEKGLAIAHADLKRFGKDERLVKEVSWLVEGHLLLSAAAFRENPRSPRTWRGLAENGVRGRRIALLAVFTVVDIRATNPDAWTPWKERLLHELVQQLERPETSSMLRFAEGLKTLKGKKAEPLIEALDPFLIGSIPTKALITDLTRLFDRPRKTTLPPQVVQVSGGKQTWVRFHSPEDRPGLFLQYVSWLATSGLAVRHASIHTHPELGVYDWFEVKTSKSQAQVTQLLSRLLASHLHEEHRGDVARGVRESVRFDAIELVSTHESEWVISFRGKDQKGALAEAARALFDAGLEVRWAKVHTWGRQIDDIFGVAPLSSGHDALIDQLSQRLTHATKVAELSKN